MRKVFFKKIKETEIYHIKRKQLHNTTKHITKYYKIQEIASPFLSSNKQHEILHNISWTFFKQHHMQNMHLPHGPTTYPPLPINIQVCLSVPSTYSTRPNLSLRSAWPEKDANKVWAGLPLPGTPYPIKNKNHPSVK